jgi:hypothetical protein
VPLRLGRRRIRTAPWRRPHGPTCPCTWARVPHRLGRRPKRTARDPRPHRTRPRCVPDMLPLHMGPCSPSAWHRGPSRSHPCPQHIAPSPKSRAPTPRAVALMFPTLARTQPRTQGRGARSLVPRYPSFVSVLDRASTSSSSWHVPVRRTPCSFAKYRGSPLPRSLSESRRNRPSPKTISSPAMPNRPSRRDYPSESARRRGDGAAPGPCLSQPNLERSSS